MIDSAILLTASASLADYWANALTLSHPLRLTDPAVPGVLAHPVDSLLLLDLALPPLDAALADQLCRHYRVLALSSVPSDEEGMSWLQSGAAGYAHAFSTPDLLQQVVETVQAGGTWVGRSIMQQLCSRVGRLVAPSSATQFRERKLSEREIEVVEALSQGLSNKAIARQLDISERTVKAHLTSVFHKFGVEDRLQLLLKLS